MSTSVFRGGVSDDSRNSPSVSLAQRYSQKTTRSLHEDTARDRVRNGWWSHVPLHGLDLEERCAIGQTPIAEQTSEAQCQHHSMLLGPRPVERVIRVVGGLGDQDGDTVSGVLDVARSGLAGYALLAAGQLVVDDVGPGLTVQLSFIVSSRHV